jgi:hypothetical protein
VIECCSRHRSLLVAFQSQAAAIARQLRQQIDVVRKDEVDGWSEVTLAVRRSLLSVGPPSVHSAKTATKRREARYSQNGLCALWTL